MNIHEIAHLPTVITVEPGERKVHESCGRAHEIVYKIKDLLARSCPNDILLELIAVMEDRHPDSMYHGPFKEAPVDQTTE